MFAYCGNNPVNFFDETGFVPQAVIDKIVHDRVLAYICGKQEELEWTGTCIYYNGVNHKGGWGFCDLYNVSTGEVWELKKESESYSCRTSTALRQLKKYTKGRLKDNLSLKLVMPYTTTIKGGKFSFEQNGYIYNVFYWSEGNGILRYSYTRRKTEEMQLIVAAALVATLVSVLGKVPIAGGAGWGHSKVAFS